MASTTDSSLPAPIIDECAALPTWLWIRVVAYLQTISDAALAELLYDHVWASTPLRTLTNDLVTEAIQRLRGEH